MRKLSRLAGFLALAVGSGLAPGCASSTSPQDVELLVAKDRAHWALPLDPYLAPHWAFEMYAVDLLSGDCMRDKGLAENPMIPYDPDAPDAATHNSSGRRLFDADIAARYGYRWASPLKYDRLRALELNMTIDQATASAQSACEEDAYERLGIEPSEDWVAREAFRFDPAQDEAVVGAAALWRECMGELGLPDLPQDPHQMPPVGLADEWGLNDDSGDGDPLYEPPVPDEVDLAVKDAACQESSGWAQAYYEAEWVAQEAYVRDNFDRLEKQRAENESRQKLFRSIIAGTYDASGN
jgi:hypothetical protein